MEEAKQNSAEQVKDDKMNETSTGGTTSKTAAAGMNQKSKTSSATEQDLDVFLLGDLGDSDDAPGATISTSRFVSLCGYCFATKNSLHPFLFFTFALWKFSHSNVCHIYDMGCRSKSSRMNEPAFPFFPCSTCFICAYPNVFILLFGLPGACLCFRKHYYDLRKHFFPVSLMNSLLDSLCFS